MYFIFLFLLFNDTTRYYRVVVAAATVYLTATTTDNGVNCRQESQAHGREESLYPQNKYRSQHGDIWLRAGERIVYGSLERSSESAEDEI